jgi:hypothetical protein
MLFESTTEINSAEEIRSWKAFLNARYEKESNGITA